MSFVRWAIVCVPLVVLLGFLSGLSAQGSQDRWYASLAKPALTPPDWAFPIAWTTLYILMGLALALVLNARGARGRRAAVALFAVALALNLAWTPIFFGAHRIGTGLIVIVLMVLAGIAATVAFGRVRNLAAWLMVPYLVWISFAGVLNWRIGQLNPHAQSLAKPARTTQVIG